jgi:hypothetical protein
MAAGKRLCIVRYNLDSAAEKIKERCGGLTRIVTDLS